MRDAPEIFLVDIFDHRHNETPIETHCHTNIDGALVDDRVTLERRVNDGEPLERVRSRLYKIRRDGELHSGPLELRSVLFTVLHDARAVDFEKCRDMR